MGLALTEYATVAQASAPPASAQLAYEAWLAEIGVTEVVDTMNGDDLLYVFNGSPCMVGGTSRMYFNTEGGIGLFFNTPPSEVQVLETLPVIGRWFGTTSPPVFRIASLSVEYSDRTTIKTRLAVSPTVTILYAEVRNLSSATGCVATAYKVSDAVVDVVATNVSASAATLCAFGVKQFGVGAETVQSNTIAANFTGTVAYHIDLSITTAPIQIQSHDPGITKLAKYDPSQPKPVIGDVAQDLQDRWPYGPYKTPAVQFDFKGRGVITGTVAEKALPINTPLRRLVRLHREPDGAFVKAVWSDDAGNYTFNGVRADHKYFVTSFDYTGTYRAVIADNLTPDVLP